MKHAMGPVRECEASCYSLEIREPLATIHFFGDIYEMATCHDAKRNFMSLLHELNEAPEIRALLVLNSPGVLGDENYCRFVYSALNRRSSCDEFGGLDQFERLGNATRQFVREIVKFRKLLIVGFDGDMASPFFGVGLGADFRYATSTMTLQPSHSRLGMGPSGGLAFFLPELIGFAKARDLLYSDKPATAGELQRLGLLDDQFPAETFHAECIDRANELARMPLSAIAETKAVLGWRFRNLMEFLEWEALSVDRAMIQGMP
jgi:enoyl-CoA hydratase/carnithine racemase